MPVMVNSVSFHNYLQQKLHLSNLKSLRRVSGGDINDSFLLEFEEDSPIFLKTKSGVHLEFYQAEADGLKALSKSVSLKVPRVLIVDEYQGEAFLALEFLEEGAKRDSQILGNGLARLHRNLNSDFGWHRNNFIGALDQINDWHVDWPAFYAEQRIIPQVKMAFDSGYLESKDSLAVERFLKRYPDLVPREKASLLHGDLWSGNVLYQESGEPALIDPAVYFGHREMDLAMMKLFGGFGSEVFNTYQENYPLEGDWQGRVPYHQLYPLLVHLNLFGLSYRNSCREIWRSFA